MEEKYGRLFTEADMRRIVGHAGHLYMGDTPSEESVTETMGVVLDYLDGKQDPKPEVPLTFPADEPLFLLRGQDAASPATIGFYTEECDRLRAPAEHQRAAEHAGGRLLAWQAANPDRVKIPD